MDFKDIIFSIVVIFFILYIWATWNDGPPSPPTGQLKKDIEELENNPMRFFGC